MSDDRPAGAHDAEQYSVGYGKPPLHTRFGKGRSGNPKGRPKGVRNLATVMTAALNEKVLITENGRKRRISKYEAAVKQLVNRAAGGEARATQLLLAIIQAGETRGPDAAPADFADGDQSVMRELMRRMEGMP